MAPAVPGRRSSPVPSAPRQLGQYSSPGRYHGGFASPLWGMSSLPAASLRSPDPKPVIAALGAFAASVIVFLTAFTVVAWTPAQTALVTAETGAILGFLAAVLAHLKPATAKEYV